MICRLQVLAMENPAGVEDWSLGGLPLSLRLNASLVTLLLYYLLGLNLLNISAHPWRYSIGIYIIWERVVSTPWGKKWSVMIIPNKLDILLSSQVVFFYWFQAANQLRIGNIPSVYIQIVLSHPDLCISILPEIIQTSIKHVQVLYLAEDYSFINLKIAELKTWSP